MKIFETKTAPNPRRVRMFMAEKGLLDKAEFIEIDLQKGENLTPEYTARNPMKKVPVMELDDGTCISESVSSFNLRAFAFFILPIVITLRATLCLVCLFLLVT